MPVVFVTDIGNTTVSWGVFDGETPVISGWHKHKGVPSRVAAVVAGSVPGKNAEVVGVSGAVPDIMNAVMKTSPELAVPVLRYRKDFKPGIEMGMDRPEETGDDRVANARAAWHLAGAGAISVDAGTAITVDVVTEEGVFVGGAILPGIQPALDTLQSRTSLLPSLKADSPITAIGSDTKQALLSGCVLGTAGAVDAIVKAMRKERSLDNCPVYLTGGDAGLINRHLVTAVQEVPHLTLLGLALDLIAAVE